jgi:hypothetical protein
LLVSGKQFAVTGCLIHRGLDSTQTSNLPRSRRQLVAQPARFGDDSSQSQKLAPRSGSSCPMALMSQAFQPEVAAPVRDENLTDSGNKALDATRTD